MSQRRGANTGAAAHRDEGEPLTLGSIPLYSTPSSQRPEQHLPTESEPEQHGLTERGTSPPLPNDPALAARTAWAHWEGDDSSHPAVLHQHLTGWNSMGPVALAIEAAPRASAPAWAPLPWL
eukprot:143687-Chlamydomonas_euryale.AAC.2